MYEYDIELDSELGKKIGNMRFLIKGTQIKGYMTILEHCEPFKGCIASDGTCRLEGKIKTLIKEFKYVATGKIGRERICMNMNIDQANYRLTGTTAVKKVEERAR